MPAGKGVDSGIDKATNMPIEPLPVGGTDPGLRVCYKMKCLHPDLGDAQITDHFGTRTVGKFKTTMLCTPAVTGSTFCGDGIRNGTEECDAGDAPGCPGTCRADCRCACVTSCCYLEGATPFTIEGGCLQYTGPPTASADFLARCGASVSHPNGLVVGKPAAGACVSTPAFGIACVVGTSSNALLLATDSSCP